METKDWQNLKKLIVYAIVILAPVAFGPAQQLGHLDFTFRILLNLRGQPTNESLFKSAITLHDQSASLLVEEAESIGRTVPPKNKEDAAASFFFTIF